MASHSGQVTVDSAEVAVVGRVFHINVLVALFDPDHVHHELAHDWFTDYRAHGWATGPRPCGVIAPAE